jgi:hypothetical protein
MVSSLKSDRSDAGAWEYPVARGEVPKQCEENDR